MHSGFMRAGLLILMLLPITAAAAGGDHGPWPERPLFRLIGTAQGLPSSSVHKLAQDRDGNLWIASLDGLARYDGIDFKVWRHDPDDPHSLPGNDIQSLMIDADDQVWVAIQDGGIARYQRDSDRFQRWRHDAADPNSLPTDRIWALASDGAGGVWLGGFKGGLSRLSSAGHLQHHRHDPAVAGSLCNDIVLTLTRADDGTLWIGTAKGVCRYREGEGFQTIALTVAPAAAAPLVLDIEIDRDRLWLATNAGLRVLALDASATVPSIPVPLAQAYGQAIVVEHDGTLWYGSQDGIHRWHPDRGDHTWYRAQPGRALALPAPSFTDALRDREGNLWFASEGGGLAQLLPRWRAVRVYLPEPDLPTGLPSGRVRLVAGGERDRQLWVTTIIGDGVAELDLDTGQARRWFVAGDGVRAPDPQVLAVLRDRSQRIWTGHRGLIARLDPRSGDYRRIEHDQHGKALPATLVRRLAEHPDGSLWAAFGGNGVARIDPESLAIAFDPLGETSALPCAEISDIQFDRHGGTWLACEHGLLIAAADGSALRVVAGAPTTAINGLAFAIDGSLWLHSPGRLLHFKVDNDVLTPLADIDAAQGWPSVRAGGLIVDDDDVVWVTTARGLYSYDPAQQRIAVYDQDDGLPSAEFCDSPPQRLDGQHFAAGTLAGAVLIDTRALRAPLTQTRLRWHQASTARGDRRVAFANEADAPLHLQFDDRDLRVAVRLDSYTKPSAQRYRFRLTGYDHDWIEQVGQPERVFERLPSGRYTLDVQAVGSDGQAAGNALRRLIEVELPPWRKPWALALYALAAIALALVVQRAYRQRLERRHALALAEEKQRWAEQTSDAKTRFLAAIGHEVRTPMAGLLGMNALLLDSPLDTRQKHYAQSVRQAGEHMLTLINDLLDLSRIEAGQLTLEPGAVDLVALADELIADVEAAAESKGLTLSLRLQPGTALAVQGDGKRLKQILLNFLSNAIKFTPAGRVRLLIAQDGDAHVFAVEDDGPGVSEDMRRKLFQRFSQDAQGRRSGGSGLGLAIARELAAMMAGECGAEVRDLGGSRFWLRLPLPPGDAVPATAADLPPLRVRDADNMRGQDLVVSLRALGANADTIEDLAAASGDIPCIVLMAADNTAQAMAEAERAQIGERPLILALPLAAALPPLRRHQRVLSGPWQLGAVLEACRAVLIPRSAYARTAQPATSAVATLAGLHLLLVEDDRILREVLSTRLSTLGATVVGADNGLSALTDIESGRFDAILLDLDLPQLGGLPLLRLLQQRLGAAAPPIVIITARQQADDEAQCRQAGARAFFRKPVDVDALTQCLLELTDRAPPTAG